MFGRRGRSVEVRADGERAEDAARVARTRRRLVHAGCTDAPEGAARRSGPVTDRPGTRGPADPRTAPLPLPPADDVVTGPLVIGPRESLSGPIHVARR